MELGGKKGADDCSGDFGQARAHSEQSIESDQSLRYTAYTTLKENDAEILLEVSRTLWSLKGVSLCDRLVPNLLFVRKERPLLDRIGRVSIAHRYCSIARIRE